MKKAEQSAPGGAEALRRTSSAPPSQGQPRSPPKPGRSPNRGPVNHVGSAGHVTAGRLVLVRFHPQHSAYMAGCTLLQIRKYPRRRTDIGLTIKPHHPRHRSATATLSRQGHGCGSRELVRR
jgi:hypothetical protein